MPYTDVLPFYDFSTDAKGGTEIMVSQLLENVDHDLLKHFDIFVSYPPQTYIKGNRPSLLWIHDLAYDPSFNVLRDKDYQRNFDFFVFVSYWQKESFRVMYDIPYEKCVVIKNAIKPQTNTHLKWDNVDKIKIVYSSTPQRGLQIVLPVFKQLRKEFSNIELDVFSSFDLYGEKHKGRNEPFLGIFEELKTTEGVNYHGSVPHEELLEQLKAQHIWVLPSLWQETSCISMMEAMSSECFCIHADLAALSETSSNFGIQYPFIEDINEHAYIFYEALKSTILSVEENNGSMSNHLLLQKLYFDNFYGWSRRSAEWTTFLKGLLKQI